MVAQTTGATTRRLGPQIGHPALPGAALAVTVAMLGAATLARSVWGGAVPWAPSVAIGSTALGGAAMLVGLVRAYPHERFGLCNALTLGRAALIAVLASVALAPAHLAEPQAGWTALALALLALALDGFDGWAARRAALASDFGARFDMEVDTVLALVLAGLVWLSGKVGLWVLALGLMRPAFVLAGLALPRLRRPLPPALWRKTVCVMQIGTLTAMLAPVVTAPLASVAAGVALALLVAGFARDVVWLWRQP